MNNINEELLAVCKYGAEELENVGKCRCGDCINFGVSDYNDGYCMYKSKYDENDGEYPTEYEFMDEDDECDCDEFNYSGNGDGVYESIHDWLNDQLDIEYTINARGEYKHGIVCIGTGGPHIEVDTRTHEVKGYWGGDRASVSVSSDAIAQLDELLEEMYECVRG